MNSSNVETPLAYFESVTNKESIKDIIDSQIFHSDIVSYEYIDYSDIQYVIRDDYGDYKQEKIHISFFVLPVLRIEFEKAKKHIDKFQRYQSDEVAKRYLTIQVRIIQNIINNKTDFIKKHSYFLLPLRGIVNYINNVLLVEGMSPFELDESPIDNIDVDFYNQSIDFNIEKVMSDEEIIISIFGFMNGLNEKREQILNSDDYSQLIDYIKYFISNESLPVIKTKLHANITNDQLSFSFWVLHKEIYTTKPIRPIFLDFLILVFDNFSNTDVYSLRKIFGAKSRVSRSKFLPDSITKYL